MLDFKIAFDQTIGSNKITLQVTRDAVLIPHDLFFLFEVLDPLNQTVRVLDVVNQPPIVIQNLLPVDQTIILGTMFTDQSNTPIQGTYKINMYIIEIQNPLSKELVTISHEYCPSTINPVLTGSIDCDTQTLTIADQTDYLTYSEERLITLVPPTIPNLSLPIETTIEPILVHALSKDNVTYSASLRSILTRTVNSSFTITPLTKPVTDFNSVVTCEIAEASTTISSIIQCGSAGCEVIPLAAIYTNGLVKKSCNLGGIGGLPRSDQDKLTALNIQLGLFNALRSCGDTSGLPIVLDEIQHIIGSNVTLTSSGPIDFPKNFNLSVRQTGWKIINPIFLLPSVTIYNNIPFRYRRLSTNHLEIQGALNISSPSDAFNVLENFFENEFAPKDSYATILGSYVHLFPVSPQIVTNLNMVAVLQDTNGNGKWDLQFKGTKPAGTTSVIINGIFAL